MQQNIIEWLDATLETLVDTSPSSNDEYAPCYIKADDLLNDYVAFKEVSIFIIIK